MKRLVMAAIAAACMATSASAADVGVSISIAEPGLYGRIDIGDFPEPQVFNPRPVVIERVPRYREPIYLHVPPGHRKHWRKHCREYNACGAPVYFVQDGWYDNEYVPHFEKRRGERRDIDRDERGPGRREKHGNKHRDDGRRHGHDR